MNQVTENYLKLIFNLQQTGNGEVKPLLLAKHLDVSPPAVSEMLKKLAQENYIDYAPYKGVKLTEKGLIQGQNMVRRHRLWEMYLHKVLGFAWDKVHEEAERLEHASSDELINRLEKALDFPEYDPHGDPIPSKDGIFPKVISSLPLATCKAGDHVKITRVSDFDNQFLHYIDNLGIQLQQRLVIQEVRSFDRSMVIQFNNKTESISEFTALHIFIVQEKAS